MTNNYSSEFSATNYDSGTDTLTKKITVDIFVKSSDYSGTDYSPDYNIDKFVNNIQIKTDAIILQPGRIKTFKVDTQGKISPIKTITVQIQTDQHDAKGINVDMIVKALGEIKTFKVDIITHNPDYSFSDYSAHDYDTGGIQYQKTFTTGIFVKQVRLVGIQCDIQTKQLGVTKNITSGIQIKTSEIKTISVDTRSVLRPNKSILSNIQTQQKSRQITENIDIQIKQVRTKTIPADIIAVNRRIYSIRVDIQIKQVGVKESFSTGIQTQKKGATDTITVSTTLTQHRNKTIQVDILTVKFPVYRVTGQMRKTIQLTGQMRKVILLTGQAI